MVCDLKRSQEFFCNNKRSKPGIRKIQELISNIGNMCTKVTAIAIGALETGTNRLGQYLDEIKVTTQI